jgi:hypothetical protein
MEDVLAIYLRPRATDFPLICFDEASKQLIAETREPIPMKRDDSHALIMNTNATAQPTSLCSLRRSKAGGM